MCCHVRSASPSSRRRRQHALQSAPLPPLAVLNLDKPAERAASEYLLRATTGERPTWRLLGMGRQGFLLLCAVLWKQHTATLEPYSVVEINLADPDGVSLRWQDFDSVAAARAALERRCIPSRPPSSDAALWP